MLAGDQLLSSLRRTQAQLLKAQSELTGNKVNVPSDAPESASIILSVQQQLARRQQQQDNLTHAEGVLGGVDTALASVTEILRQALNVAKSQDDILSDDVTRQETAETVAGQIRSLMSLANQKYQSVFLFGGSASVAGDVVMEDVSGGGVRYLGNDGKLSLDVGLAEPVAFNSNAVEAFGSVSARVRGTVDLNPMAWSVSLSDLNGALGEGIRLGSVLVTVNGVQTTVDLKGANSLEDVQQRLSAAMSALRPSWGGFEEAENGLVLRINPGTAIAISDVDQGKAAADLGIAMPTTLGPRTFVGADLDARLKETTSLAAIPGVWDWSGLTITQGQVTKVADFSRAENIGDLAMVVQQLGLGLRLEINQDGTGLNLVSDVSGVDFSVAENGGRTAEQLGLRTLGLGTKLADFNYGLGVEGLPGEDDFEVDLHDGRSFRVSVSGLETVQDLLNAMSAAATSAGIASTDFEAGLSSSGNAIVLQDHTVGTGSFQIVALSANGKQSWAAADLGFVGERANAGAGDTITSEDRAKVRVESVFTHMKALQDALLSNDTRGMAFAASKLQADLDQVLSARANAGVKMAWVQDTAERSKDLQLAEETMLSNLQGADMTEAITRFTQLMTQLEATLRVGATGSQMSLLDYLR